MFFEREKQCFFAGEGERKYLIKNVLNKRGFLFYIQQNNSYESYAWIGFGKVCTCHFSCGSGHFGAGE